MYGLNDPINRNDPTGKCDPELGPECKQQATPTAPSMPSAAGAVAVAPWAVYGASGSAGITGASVAALVGGLGIGAVAFCLPLLGHVAASLIPAVPYNGPAAVPGAYPFTGNPPLPPETLTPPQQGTTPTVVPGATAGTTTTPTTTTAPVPVPVPTAVPTVATPTPDCNLPSGQFPMIPIIPESRLVRCRPEAAITIARIRSDGPFPTYNGKKRDDVPFFNADGYLPPPSDPTRQTPTGYREYTVLTPGVSHRGARRIVTFGPDISRKPSNFAVMYYTDDHYTSFTAIQQWR